MKSNIVIAPLILGILLSEMPMRGQVAASSTSAPARGAEEQVVELSPFEVSESDASGYSANSTLAGTRLNTELRDLGASLSIITPEFLADTASTNAAELLVFTTGTEVGGVSGNYAGGDESDARPNQSEARENPQNNQRIRGVGAAANTRDFFLTDIPFDSYNTSRVTINRGPNSLLFGIGNPAGVIDASLSKAQLNRNRTEIGVRAGSNGSYRGTLDDNRVLIKGRLAYRLAAVTERNNYDQDPAFDRKNRVYGTVEGVVRKGSNVLGRTVFRATGEIGKSNSIPVNVIPPLDAFRVFFAPPAPSIDDFPGVTLHPSLKPGQAAYIWVPRATVDNRVLSTSIAQNNGSYYAVPYFVQIPLIFDTPNQVEPGFHAANNPALNGIDGIMGRIRYPASAPSRGPVDAISTVSAYAQTPGFVTPSIQDRRIFDYRKRLISGKSNTVRQNFDTASFMVIQDLFDRRAGLELAYDWQKTSSRRELPFSYGLNGAGNGQSDVYIDVSQYLTNGDPNPNLGRPFIQQLGVTDRLQRNERESIRATAFARFDFERNGRKLFGIPLGNHTVAGLYTQQNFDARGETYQTAWESDARDLNATVFQSAIGAAFRRTPVLVQYVGPSLLNASGYDAVRLTDVFAGHLPRNGDKHVVTFWDTVARKLVTEELWVRRFLNGGSLSRQEIASESVSIKSDFFKNHIVSVVGWRWDQLKTFANETNIRLADGTLDPDFQLNSKPNLNEDSRNFTWSVVGRYPQEILPDLPFGTEVSAYYNESGNFNPVNVRSNLRGEVIAAPNGTTKEYGVIIEFLERRASLRLNWFHTTQSNSSNNAQGATGTVFNFPNFMITRYQNAETQGIDFTSIPGVTAAGYKTYAQLYEAFFNLLPEPVNSRKNLRFDKDGLLVQDSIPGLTDVTNLDARGFEAELVGQIWQDLRLSLNVARQSTVTNGSARLTKEVADALFANLTKLNLTGIDQGPALPERMTASTRYTLDIATPLAATVARDGAKSSEQREWRANLVATYNLRRFENSILKKMSIGSALRWQSRIAIGNPFLTGARLKKKIVETNTRYTDPSQISDTDPVMQTQFPDLENPIYGPEELTGDVWLTYSTRISRKVDWRLQLNVRNAWGNNDDIPVKANPDGSIAVVRIPNETRWLLSSTFVF